MLGAGFTKDATVYACLFTVLPTDSTSGTEPTGVGSYARVAITNNTTNWPNAAGGIKSNGTAITFPTASAAWGTIVGFGLANASSAGTVIGFGSLSAPRAVVSGDTPSFAIGTFIVTLD